MKRPPKIRTKATLRPGFKSVTVKTTVIKGPQTHHSTDRIKVK